jgi:hypothetical protein
VVAVAVAQVVVKLVVKVTAAAVVGIKVVAVVEPAVIRQSSMVISHLKNVATSSRNVLS